MADVDSMTSQVTRAIAGALPNVGRVDVTVSGRRPDESATAGDPCLRAPTG